jgi:2-oxo-4-hydroxy-4-carboxy-5-ureidoimidazoline decarboxylase
MTTPMTLAELNSADQAGFVAAVGHLFEHSPWIAAEAWAQRPFASREALHAALTEVMHAAGYDRQVALISAHPDLAGQLAQAGALTAASTQEQAAAGLDQLTEVERAQFTAYNTAYRARFGFPFVICARENKKAAILSAFPIRLEHTREQEIAMALAEIANIAWLRLIDTVV